MLVDVVQQQSGVARALLRRWYLVALGAVATLALCWAAASLVPVQHALTARVLLVPPPLADDPAANPYLSLGGLEPAASVLAKSLSAAETTRELEDQGAAGTFTIVPDLTTNGPVILVEVEAPTPAQALETLTLVLRAAPEKLAQLQGDIGVPVSSAIRSTVISQDDEAATVRKSQIRAVLVAAVLGATGVLMGTCLLDALLRRRASKGVAAGPPRLVRARRSYRPVHLVRETSRGRVHAGVERAAVSDSTT